MFSIKNNRVNKRLFYKWLPLQDAFRTLDWVKTKEELEKLRFVLDIQSIPLRLKH